MKKNAKLPRWVATLRALMEDRGYNPRSLSLKAGLNATAVRDILEGRAKYPRYDTVGSLARILEVAPDDLMNRSPKDILNKKPVSEKQATKSPSNGLEDDDLELLTEIIGKLQNVADEYKQTLKPKDFAAMVTTIFSHTQTPKNNTKMTGLSSPINQLMTYERLRKQGNK